MTCRSAGVKRVIAPKLNEPDADEVPDHLRKELEFVFVDEIDDVLRNALESEVGKRAKGSSKNGRSREKVAAKAG